MNTWIIIIDYPADEHSDPRRDVELLDIAPRQSLLEELFSLVDNGQATRAEVREGNINGGDSIVTWCFPVNQPGDSLATEGFADDQPSEGELERRAEQVGVPFWRQV